MFGLEQRSASDELALISAANGRCWTYAELAAEVGQRSQRLSRIPRGLAFLFCRNDSESLFWYLALLQSGHPAAMLDAGLSPATKQELIAHYEPDLVLGHDPGDGFKDVDGHDGSMMVRRTCEPHWPPPHDDLVLLLPTSGTTGNPRFVRLSGQNLEANASGISSRLGIDAKDRAVAHLPLHYSYGLSVVNSHLLAGAALMFGVESVMQAGFWEAVRKYRITSFAGVPYTYAMLKRLGLERLEVPTLRRFTQAGGKLDPGTMREIQTSIEALGGEFWIMYGATEATARMTILDATSLRTKFGSVGTPLPGGAVRILDGDGGQVGSNVPGDIEYTGPNVMLGYALRRADLALGDTQGGRLMTGDRGYVDDEGFLYVQGRTKREAKVYGLRISLDDLEAMLASLGAVAAVEGKDGVVVYCEFSDPERLHEAKMLLSTRLKVNHQAFAFRAVERLPTLSSGKVDYQALASLP